jgi:drug/metabolite transporter (DMT)-like permease
MDNISSFLSATAAVSVAVERIVEILKGLLPKTWLFEPKSDPALESFRCAMLHVLAGICGTAVAAVSKVDIWHRLNQFQVLGQQPHWYYWWGSYAFTGLLSSGGSAMWNHALDILKATKVTQEQSAKALTAKNASQSAAARGTEKAADPEAVVI